MSMDVIATLFNKSVPCKILNCTVWSMLRGLPPVSLSQGERFYARRQEESNVQLQSASGKSSSI